MPLTLDDLKNQHLAAKEKATALFKKKAVGDTIDEYAKELRKKIKMKYCNLRLENEREFNVSYSLSSLITLVSRESQAPSSIVSIVPSNENSKATSIVLSKTLKKDLRSFQSFFLESGPNGPNKKLVVVEFLQKALNEGAIVFMKNVRQELELQKMVSQ